MCTATPAQLADVATKARQPIYCEIAFNLAAKGRYVRFKGSVELLKTVFVCYYCYSITKSARVLQSCSLPWLACLLYQASSREPNDLQVVTAYKATCGIQLAVLGMKATCCDGKSKH